MPRPKMDCWQVADDIARRYKEGETIGAIMAEYGVSRTLMRDLLRSKGVVLDQNKRSKWRFVGRPCSTGIRQYGHKET
jgi:hypothetical protein